MARIEWTRPGLKDLKKLQRKEQNAVIDKLDELAQEPPPPNLDVKKLTDRDGEYRLRVGDYRVIYTVIGGTPQVLRIQRVLRRTSQTY